MEFFELTQRVDEELTQLLLVVRAAEILGWVSTPGQRVQMTAEGHLFLAASTTSRKQMLNARLREIFVFRLVTELLKQSESGEVDDEVVVGELALHLPNENPSRLWRTIVAWGRYAGLFQYSSTRKALSGVNLNQPETQA